MCNITKHQPYLDIDYEELKNVNVVQLNGEEEDNAEFSKINPDLLDLNLEDNDGESKGPAALAIEDNLLLPNQQFYEICLQLDKGQKHGINFVM